MISLGARAVKAVLRIATYRYRKNHMSLSRNVKLSSKPYTPPKDYNCKTEIYGGIRTEILSHKNCRKEKIILHIHGGGAAMGMNTMYGKAAQRYAGTGYPVYSIDYNAGKEKVHPSLLHECISAYKGIIKSGIEPQRIIMVGDSMGANLALALCLKLRDRGAELPAAIAAVSPFIDLTASGDSYRKNCYTDPLYSLPKNQSFEENEKYIRRKTPYCGTSDPKDPYLSPAFGDYSGFPPMLIQCGDCETSESDSDMLYERAKRAGVKVTLTKYEGMFHDFQYFAPFLKESKEAWNEIYSFIKRV